MISEKYHTKLSKFLSLVLRHKPEEIGLSLDAQGWALVDELMDKMNAYGKHIDLETLELIVLTNSKKRFILNEDNSRIRANQGHSINIDLNLLPQTPPGMLFHGTATKFVDSIYENGILRQNRQHVHLSKDKETAQAVGQRHGKPVIFEVLASEMFEAGHAFYVSENGVWLTEVVPAQFIRKVEV